MKTSSISILLSAMALAFAGTALAADAPAATNAGTDRTTPAGAPARTGELEKGMSAEKVIGLVGKPTRITELKMAEGKAEKWIYRHLVSQRAEPEATNAATVAAFAGAGGQGNNDLGTGLELQFTMKHTATYQVTALLMVNDHLVVAKQWNEQEVTYDH